MTSNESDFASSPVIIIGAGRSGTNMLRDLLVRMPQVTTWPCDEINYIWRHGNRAFPTDEFAAGMATPETARFIQDQFVSLSRRNPGCTIVEKTCANSLRCSFVREVFPKAKFIHIVRDGRDVAASAALRWNAKLDIGYILRKARYVPWSDIPYYGANYLKARLYRLTSGQSRLSTWGPKFDGMSKVFEDHELSAGCAIQWKRCVELSREQLRGLAPDQLLTIRYEDFTANPVQEFAAVCEFVGVGGESDFQAHTAGVSNRSVGKWATQLSEEQAGQIQDLAGPLLAELGYVTSPTDTDS